MIAPKDEISYTSLNNFEISFSSFTGNKGIDIKLSTHSEQISIYISNSYFLKCYKTKGGAINFETTNVNQDKICIEKTCGAYCYLTGSDQYGIFYYIRAIQQVNLISYYGTSSEDSRDTTNHENGMHMVSNANISHNHVSKRSFTYFNPIKSSVTFKYSTSFNNTATEEPIIWIKPDDLISATLICISFVECDIENDQEYLIYSTSPSTTFIESSFVECSASNYFNGDFIFIHCYFDNIDTKSLNIDISMPSTEIKYVFLDTFFCDAKYSKLICFTCKKKTFNFNLFYNNFLIPIIIS